MLFSYFSKPKAGIQEIKIVMESESYLPGWQVKLVSGRMVVYPHLHVYLVW